MNIIRKILIYNIKKMSWLEMKETSYDNFKNIMEKVKDLQNYGNLENFWLKETNQEMKNNPIDPEKNTDTNNGENTEQSDNTPDQWNDSLEWKSEIYKETVNKIRECEEKGEKDISFLKLFPDAVDWPMDDPKFNDVTQAMAENFNWDSIMYTIKFENNQVNSRALLNLAKSKVQEIRLHSFTWPEWDAQLGEIMKNFPGKIVNILTRNVIKEPSQQ